MGIITFEHPDDDLGFLPLATRSSQAVWDTNRPLQMVGLGYYSHVILHTIGSVEIVYSKDIMLGAWDNEYLVVVVGKLIYGGSSVLMKLSLQEGLRGGLGVSSFFSKHSNTKPALNQIVVVVYRHVLAMVLETAKTNSEFMWLSRKQRPWLSFPIRSTRVQAKVVGTLFCIGGSLIFTFWKGGYLLKAFIENPLINVSNGEGTSGGMRHVKQNWIKGSALILTSHIAWSAWLILQAVVSKVYPAPLSLTTMICFFRVVAIFFTRPVFRKRSQLMEAAVEPAAHNHHLLLIEALLIIVRLYCVLWGKRKDALVAEHAEIEKVMLDDNKVLEISMTDISAVNPVTIERT
ncbi:unnamed protein product [Malus baccata var. baccata]